MKLPKRNKISNNKDFILDKKSSNDLICHHKGVAL